MFVRDQKKYFSKIKLRALGKTTAVTVDIIERNGD